MTIEIKIDLEEYEALVNVARKAYEVVKFCYAQDGCWIGRETISKSGKFTELIADLRDSLYTNDTESENEKA